MKFFCLLAIVLVVAVSLEARPSKKIAAKQGNDQEQATAVLVNAHRGGKGKHGVGARHGKDGKDHHDKDHHDG